MLCVYKGRNFSTLDLLDEIGSLLEAACLDLYFSPAELFTRDFFGDDVHEENGIESKWQSLAIINKSEFKIPA